MKKIALTLGAAVVALTAVQASNAEAGVRVQLGWYGGHHNWTVHSGSPYYYGGPRYNCFWRKRKLHTAYGWRWKKVRVCNPYYRYY